tara:strand:+ start:1803 stop:3140 length:1338 start_codon:yes stop_codon:yes gene_type:complete
VTTKSIFIHQKKIISNLKEIIRNLKKKNLFFSFYDYFYFTNWSENYGSRKINLRFNKNFSFYNYLKSIIKFSYEFSSREFLIYEIYSKINKKKSYDNLLITYTNNIEINKKKFVNRIFKTPIDNLKSTLCLVINFDILNNKKQILNDNIILVNKKKIFLFNNLLFYISFFKYLFLVISNKKEIYDKNFYSILEIEIKNILKDFPIKRIFLAYESQPHQHYIIHILKKIKKDLYIIGYLHSCLPSLPFDFIFKKDEPDLLLTNGKEQKNILVKNLGWPNKKVNSVKSFRYTYQNKDKYLNKIFLPYAINNVDEIIKSFKYLLSNNQLNNLKKFKIQNHPFTGNSKKHKMLLSRIKEAISIKKTINTRSNNSSIVIGVSASILEILEYGVDVINICENEILHSHSENIWKNIKVTKLAKNVFKYSIKRKRSIINFGNKDEFKRKYGL